jgi:hypothetical protein
MHAIGKSELIDYAVGIGGMAKFATSKFLAYRESHGYEARLPGLAQAICWQR